MNSWYECSCALYHGECRDIWCECVLHPEIVDQETVPYRLYVCKVCRAITTTSWFEEHLEWHEKIGDVRGWRR